MALQVLAPSPQAAANESTNAISGREVGVYVPAVLPQHAMHARTTWAFVQPLATPAWNAEGYSPRDFSIRLAIKRSIDIIGAVLLLAILAGPMLILGLMIKLTSRGPILYRQKRVGLGGRTFTMLKFRTMVEDAEALTGPIWCKKNDPRRTRVGALMRQLCLDELPQLINVVRGEMSLIGPRPERPFFVKKFSQALPSYSARHQVRPGLTGLAQIHGLRGNTSIEERLDRDLRYIANWSLTMDLYILLITPYRVLADKNGY